MFPHTQKHIRVTHASPSSHLEEEEPREKQDEPENGGGGRIHVDEAGNYYFADPDKIDKLLSVQVYADYMPTIPAKELHASSVQHPQHPQYRWLLHSRRVAMLTRSPEDETRSEASASMHPSGFRCAGIGDAEQRAYICKVCRNALCREVPVMPWCALANLLWGGREHLDYQGLSDAMRTLLG